MNEEAEREGSPAQCCVDIAAALQGGACPEDKALCGLLGTSIEPDVLHGEGRFQGAHELSAAL